MNECRTVITGLGALTALGSDLRSTMQGLREERRSDQMVEPDPVDGPWAPFRGHPIREVDGSGFFSRADQAYLSEQQLAADKDLLLLLAAVRMALADSFPDGIRGRRVGLVVAHENPGVTHLIRGLMGTFFSAQPENASAAEYARTLFRRHRSAFFHVQAFPHLFHIARIFSIHGMTLHVNNACASGLYAVEAAHQMIAHGHADAVVVAASDHAAHPLKDLWFRDMDLITSDVTRPFDRRRSGFLLGDAGAALLLERLAPALERGARSYAEYGGAAFAQEGWHMALPDVADRAYRRCMTDALVRAGVTPHDVDLVVAHGTATALGDRYESLCLTEAFGGPASTPPVTAFKSLLGHTLGASALLETVVLLASMAEGSAPRAACCETPDPAIPLRLLRQSAPGPVRVALKTVNAFAGFDAAAVFKAVVP